MMPSVGSRSPDLQPYGLSPFLDLTHPVVLVVSDQDDVSAFLSDADTAWEKGVFAAAMTTSTVTVVQLVPLSPRPVPPDPASSLLPDLVLSTEDRGAVVRQRPWLERYLVVTLALRRRGRPSARVSGFGGRLTATPHRPDAPDAPDAPVLVVDGDGPLALDPSGDTETTLTATDLALLEHLQDPAGEVGEEHRRVLDHLLRRGVAVDWSRRRLDGTTDPPSAGVCGTRSTRTS